MTEENPLNEANVDVNINADPMPPTTTGQITGVSESSPSPEEEVDPVEPLPVPVILLEAITSEMVTLLPEAVSGSEVSSILVDSIPIPVEEDGLLLDSAPTDQTEIPTPINLEERCAQLERQLAKAAEATQLRKRLIEIRETESKSLNSKLKVLSEAIQDEKRSRMELLKRVEAAELECATVKDKLRRNLEALERTKGHHERRVTMLTANLEIADIKAQGGARKLEESHRKNAEQKGLLEELTMKLNENRKVTKSLEKQLKKSTDKNVFLSSQLALIGQLLGEDGSGGSSCNCSSASASFTAVGGDEEGSFWKIKNIIRQSEASGTEKDKNSAEDGPPEGSEGGGKDQEDEGIELSSASLLELENEDESEAEPVKDIPGEESCYKRVDTSTGPKLILSVSKTFIKLKDLILEKRSLQQEIGGFKSLNAKLESKLDKQEHRLYCVTKELNKTWHLVSKLKLQQDRLHNNEAFLRYELKENRAVVERLKKEMLSYKEKWRKVREKNDESQCVWQQLKDEFAQRRQESLIAGQSCSSSSSTPSSPSTPTPPPPPGDSSSSSAEESSDGKSQNPTTSPISPSDLSPCGENVDLQELEPPQTVEQETLILRTVETVEPPQSTNDPSDI